MNSGYWLLFGICCWVIGVLLSGCGQKTTLERAQNYVSQSQAHYQEAVNIYKELIKQGKDLDRLHFELGQLYFSQGEFEQAIKELKDSGQSQAKKLLAISYYRLGNFTDAYEVFSKNALLDAQSQYYYGLTAEKLNLFDQALDIYKKIKEKNFASLALARINLIEKQANALEIKEIDPKVYQIIATSPSEDKYPQAGALILLAEEKIEITPENRQVAEMHYVVKILNERGKEEFSESHIDYDTTYEKVELVYARTIKPDGRVVDVGSRHIRDVSKYLNFPLYSNAHVYIISFPEITAGSVIDYKLKIYRHQLINQKDFVFSYPLQTSEPIMQADFSLSLPKEKPLQIKILNEQYNNFGADLNPKKNEVGACVLYTWQFKNIPQIIPESNMPPTVQINPTMILSSFKSWQDIYNWWWNLTQDKIKADSPIKEKAKELIKGKGSPEEKIRAIYNFCAKEIRYVAVEYGQAGFQPHKASDTLKNKYGDCKDKAILLVTLLKEAGIVAWPVLISTKEYYNLNEDFPAVLFNHAIAAVPLEEKIVFLDTTLETCGFGDLPADDQDRRVLIFKDKDDGYLIQPTPLYPARHNLNRQSIAIKINQDGSIWVQKSIFTQGIYDQMQRLWLLYTPPELVGETLGEKIQNISIGAKLTDYNVKNLNNLDEPVRLDYTFTGPEYFTLAGNLRILPQLTSIDTSIVAKDKRKFSIDFGVLDSKETIFEVAIPQNFVLKYIPESFTEENPWLKFSVQYSYKANKLFFQQFTELKKNIVEVEDYLKFKACFENLAKKIKQRVILEKVK